MGLGRRQQQQQQQQQQQPGDISARASTATCSPTETERKEERKRLGTPVGSFAAALQPGSPDPVCLRRAFLRQSNPKPSEHLRNSKFLLNPEKTSKKLEAPGFS
ncbi:uncharacterized protein PHA67_006959 isoform 1-T1 [Liasis olivaceus]